MKLVRLIGYFLQLNNILGFGATCSFCFSYALHIVWPQKGELAHMPVGPYVFYFPSFAYFEGLFTEIFFKGTYFLAPTTKPIWVIDCGANIGMSLLYVKVRAPQARVLCFEPNPAARAVLERNIAANKWGDDVQVFPFALGKERGTADFFVDNNETTSSGGSVARYQKNETSDFNSYTVDVDVLSHYINGTVDLLKMDIEGPEFDVLEELRATNKLRSIATIQLEYHYIPGFFTRPLSEMLSLLEKAGFHTFVQANAPAHQIINQDVMHTYMVFAWR